MRVCSQIRAIRNEINMFAGGFKRVLKRWFPGKSNLVATKHLCNHAWRQWEALCPVLAEPIVQKPRVCTVQGRQP